MPFCSFEAFWGKFIETFLFIKKLTISEKRTEELRKFVFLTMFEKWQILRKIWICFNHFFWSNLYKGVIINKNCFSPQSEPPTTKLSLSVVLKHFWENSEKNYLFCPKIDYLRNKPEILRNFVFLTWLEKG